MSTPCTVKSGQVIYDSHLGQGQDVWLISGHSQTYSRLFSYMSYTTIVTYKGRLCEFSIENNDCGSTPTVLLINI